MTMIEAILAKQVLKKFLKLIGDCEWIYFGQTRIRKTIMLQNDVKTYLIELCAKSSSAPMALNT